MAKRKLLVTGGAGFIGSNFVHLATDSGYSVVVLDALTYAAHRENLKNLSTPARLELIVGNICNGNLVLDLLNQYEAGAVINFAAESHVDRSITGPAPFIETNISGTFSLLNASLAYWESLNSKNKPAFRYVQISTDEVFGSLGHDGRFCETTAMAPNSPYSASKASGDHLVRAWNHTYGLPTLITHSSNNYGPRQHPEKLIPRMISCALAEEPLPVYGTGSNVRDWIHVNDHCRAILLALELGEPGDTYCFGGNAERTNLEVVQAICRELDRSHPRADGKNHETAITFVPDRPGHDFRYAIDDSLAQKKLGFSRQYGFEQGLAETVGWYLENSQRCQSGIAVNS